MNYSDKLLQKLEEELKEFKSYIKEQGVDFAIDKAYELTIKQEIIDVLIYDSELSDKQIKALLRSDKVLDECYDDWLHCDGNLKDTLLYSVDESINTIADRYKKDKIKTNKEVR